MASRLQDVILRGTRAAQPLATDVAPGTLYYVTDEEVTERSDGTSWESFTDAGGLAAINISAGTTSNNLSNLVFSNSNGVSFGLNASTITASVAAGLSNINFSAGTTSNNLSNIVFSNSNNVSFGLDGSTITASAAGGGGGGGVVQSFWANFQQYPLANATTSGNIVAGTRMIFAPLFLPYDLTGSYLRQLYNISLITQTLGTTANTSFTMTGQSRFAYVIFTLGTGASSNSLLSLYSNATTITTSLSFTANANGSEYSFTQGMTFPLYGGTITTSDSQGRSSANINVGFLNSGVITGFRFVDIPFGTSLPAGAYWIGLGEFSSRSNGGPTGLSSNNMIMARAEFSFSTSTQLASAPRPFLFTAINNFFMGQGHRDTGAQVSSTSAIDLSNISANFNFRPIQIGMQAYHVP